MPKIPGKVETRQLIGVKALGSYGSPLAAFRYSGPSATDSAPLVFVLTYPSWQAKSTKDLYITGINLKGLPLEDIIKILKTYGKAKAGTVQYREIANLVSHHPACCVRTYNTKHISSLHIVSVEDMLTRLQ